jgi:hypothetical protein
MQWHPRRTSAATALLRSPERARRGRSAERGAAPQSRIRARVDTSQVTLPDALVELVPTLAEGVHDVWAGQRESDGWSYGPRRDDAEKQHPGLVEYALLPESEREYDRVVVTQVLKMLLALGYQIVR